MVFEILSDKNFQSNFGDLKECESLWQEIDESAVDVILSTGFDVKLEVLKDKIKEGKAISTFFGIIRLKNDSKKCPLCGSSFKEPFYSTSIVDNKTKICPDCGTREQLERYFGTYAR